MKKDIHPKTHPVIFVDGEHEIISRSTLTSGDKRDIDGVEHFVIPVEISSFTHPFYTGEQRIIDTAGQVERFMRRLEAGIQQREDKEQADADKKEAELEEKRTKRGLKPLKETLAKEDAEDEA